MKEKYYKNKKLDKFKTNKRNYIKYKDFKQEKSNKKFSKILDLENYE